MAENFRPGVNAPGSAGDDAQIVFRQAAPEAEAAIPGRARSQGHGKRIDGVRAGHDGVGGGAQFQHLPVGTAAAEGSETAAGRCDFPVRRHGKVEVDEGERVDWGMGDHGQ